MQEENIKPSQTALRTLSSGVDIETLCTAVRKYNFFLEWLSEESMNALSRHGFSNSDKTRLVNLCKKLNKSAWQAKEDVAKIKKRLEVQLMLSGFL